MTAAEIREALQSRWPDSEYLSIPEAPQSSDRGGRKLDLLVVSLWLSRGLALDGVEIKVHLSDWKRELKTAEKADWWWRHVNRFWVAVPMDLAAKVKPDLPPTWGLLACEPDKPVRVVVKAPAHDPEPLPWHSVVGLMRAAAGCGLNALQRAEHRGYDRGVEAGKRMAEPGRVAERYESLREEVRRFEEETGLRVRNPWDAREIGAAVAIVRAEVERPGWMVESFGHAATRVRKNAAELQRQAAEIERAAEAISAKLSEAKGAACMTPATGETR